MIRLIKSLVICLFMLFSSIPAFADIYKYVDDNGSIVFTNIPTTIPSKKIGQVKVVREIKKTVSSNDQPVNKTRSVSEYVTTAPVAAPAPSNVYERPIPAASDPYPKATRNIPTPP